VIYNWPNGPVEARADYRPWMDRPGAIYDRWRDPDRLAWRAAVPRVVYAPRISTPVRKR